jgi:hypothetical protein
VRLSRRASFDEFAIHSLNDRAGAAGCPLAQTLVEGGQKVLLVERGGERIPTTDNVNTLQDAIFGPCTETFSSGGVSEKLASIFV